MMCYKNLSFREKLMGFIPSFTTHQWSIKYLKWYNLCCQTSVTDWIKDKDNSEDPQIVEVLDPQLINVETSTLRISANDSNGFKAVLLSLIGDYEAVVTDYTYQQNNYQYLSHSINIDRDWSWICSCGIFALLIYCTFRSIGGILARF